MTRTLRRAVTRALAASALMAMLAAGGARALECQISVGPPVARVGEEAVVTATGYLPLDIGTGLGARFRRSDSISIQFDENGTYTRTFVVQSFMIGQLDVAIVGVESGCRASFSWTVLPVGGHSPGTSVAPVVPNTSTAPGIEPGGGVANGLALVAVLLALAGTIVFEALSGARRRPE